MIPRYSRKEISELWSDKSRFDLWLDVELAVCEAWAEDGQIPKSDMEAIRKKASFDLERIEEIEKETKHDVIAFLTAVAEKVGPSSRFIHMGMTSSDLLDTAFALQLKKASEKIIEGLGTLISVLKKRAMEHKDTPMMGRSHGIHAEPITFGLKMALFYDEFKRNLKRMESAKDAVSVGKISGAVGTFANISPKIEEKVCKKLGLEPAKISTQVVQRDHHAQFFTTLGIIASSIEQLAVEIRHLQRTEVMEAEEPFTKGQKGSSAMPHKRNPILTENLTGLARVVRSNSLAAMENVALWHERDISHSSVERIIGPDSTILVDFMLARLSKLVDGLVVYPENMKKNLEKTGGLIFSQQVLLGLIEKGLTREDAYKLVQKNAMESWKSGKSFNDLLKNDSDVTKVMSPEDIDKLFDLKYHLKYVDEIFNRVFN
jgi:adenylosuccinate lyase